jgi:hypothetical protein
MQSAMHAQFGKSGLALMDVSAWLVDNGFELLVDLFGENEVDGEVLRELTDDHLEDIGTPPGHGSNC